MPTVTPESFEAHVAFLARHRYRVWELGALADALARGQRIERRSTVITFDDGYEETCRLVAPLLKRVGIPATVFVTPAEVGTPGFMTWDQIRAIANEGISIGSHTFHHAYLPLIPLEEVRWELSESKQAIERQVGRPVELLCYPIGGYTPEVQRMAQACGYQAACTTNRGVSRHGYDLFALRRIKITERDRSPVSLWMKLTGYYNYFRQLEQPA